MQDPKAMLHKITKGWTAILLGCIAEAALMLFYDDNDFMPKWRPLISLVLFAAFVYLIIDWSFEEAFALSMLVMFGLALLSAVLFNGPHPMKYYAAVRYDTENGFIAHDLIYLREAPLVQLLEKTGPRKVNNWGSLEIEYLRLISDARDDVQSLHIGLESVYIERYLYSPRMGLLLGKDFAMGEGEPRINDPYSGIQAWLLGIRAACEEFAFWAINLTPLLLAYAIYCKLRKRPQGVSGLSVPTNAWTLLVPFCIGLFPLMGL